MKAILLLYDSLNRHMLSCYGCDWTKTPNFKRLAEKTTVFDNNYIGSMPCMPARRDMHTGRLNFLHRGWGPIEPYDDSAIERMKYSGIYTHMITDHYHYWEDGGATYHNRFDSCELIRGQEGDNFKADVKQLSPKLAKIPKIGGHYSYSEECVIHYEYNRTLMDSEDKQPQPQTIKAGLEFLDVNHDADNWFLQLETFDPHEPFFTQKEYHELFPHKLNDSDKDWPVYGSVTESPEEAAHYRMRYASLLAMCDKYLGKLLDKMDGYNLWEDTLFICTADHGFLLGEHNYWAKVVMPYYNEQANSPLFIWDPRLKRAGERCNALTQTIDIPATLLEFFGLERPKEMQGLPLIDAVVNGESDREAVIFGQFGGHVHCTDGKYVYMRGIKGEKNEPLYQYSMVPMHLNNPFPLAQMRTQELCAPFCFTKQCKIIRTVAGIWDKPQDVVGLKRNSHSNVGICDVDLLDQNLLFDLENDPNQLKPIDNKEAEEYMIHLLVKLMKDTDAPKEQYIRLGLEEYV